MRELVYQTIANDTQLHALGLTVDAVSSGDVDSPAERPYVVLRWGETTPGVDKDTRRVNSRNLVVWIHDQPGDYTRIDQILKRIRTVLIGLYAAQTSTGWLTGVDWTTDSSDLSDDVTGTIARTSAYQVIGSD